MWKFVIIVAAASYGLGTGRTIPSIAAVIGLIGVITGALSLLRPSMTRTGGGIALVLGLISSVVGGLHAAYAAGGVGTGNGLAGAVVAVALGIIAIVLGAISLARSRRT